MINPIIRLFLLKQIENLLGNRENMEDLERAHFVEISNTLKITKITITRIGFHLI